ncbi:MAG TPA: MarR family transcriptional regulator [Blastocatellia bacterium]|jgi:DNA-binding MarR family transcriptional regulator|nr:MarR family transcriptional regulator [Blastocatellia bacterium]
MEPAEAKIAQCVCGSVRKAARAVTKVYDDALRPAGIRITQLGILGVAVRIGPVTVTQLAEATMTDRTTLTRNLKVLEQKDFIRIEAGNDQREREITVTSQGREALSIAYPIWKEVQSKVIKSLGEDRWNVLRDGLAAVTSLGKDD